jgi:hypothetical protein
MDEIRKGSPLCFFFGIRPLFGIGTELKWNRNSELSPAGCLLVLWSLYELTVPKLWVFLEFLFGNQLKVVENLGKKCLGNVWMNVEHCSSFTILSIQYRHRLLAHRSEQNK